jgi:hypothetical protein
MGHNNSGRGEWQITTEGCAFPVWSRSGNRLYFVRLGDHAVMFVDYTSDGASFRPGQPRMLGAGALAGDIPSPFDIAPDGRRVIAVPGDDHAAEEGRGARVTFVLNWADELRRRVPAGGR